MVGASGMGMLSEFEEHVPLSLQEAYFTETKLVGPFMPFVDEPQFCRKDTICTDILTAGERQVISALVPKMHRKIQE